jgi:hypothetical protein
LEIAPLSLLSRFSSELFKLVALDLEILAISKEEMRETIPKDGATIRFGSQRIPGHGFQYLLRCESLK